MISNPIERMSVRELNEKMMNPTLSEVVGMGDGRGDGQVSSSSVLHQGSPEKAKPVIQEEGITSTTVSASEGHKELNDTGNTAILVGSQEETVSDGTNVTTPVVVGGGPGGRAKGNRRLYIGNISTEVTEENLREFFESHGFGPENIARVMLRNGYAFVECQDPSVAARIATGCNMKTFMSTVLRVEAAERPPAYKSRMAGLNRQRSYTQILVKNCDPETNLKDVQAQFSQFGPVTVEQGMRSGTFVVHTMGGKQSDALISEFHGKALMGSTRLIVHSLPDNAGAMLDGSGDAHNNFSARGNSAWKGALSNNTSMIESDYPRGSSIPSSAYAAYQSVVQSAAEPPLKILVPNEFVGAVIGRGGATIRAISKGTGARLDIFRNCSRYDVPEKPVTIYGPPEKASKACKKILEIIIQENNHHQELQIQQNQQAGQQQQQPPQQQRQEIALRMFAQDSYIGRVIGKGGSVIKKIMEESQTKIHISTQSDFMGKDSTTPANRHYFPPVMERLITIRGSIDGMCKAEEIISEKLREAYQNETRMYENGYAGNNYSTAGRGGYVGGGGSDDEYIRPSSGGPARRKFNSRTPFTLSTNINNINLSQYIPGGTYANYPTSAAAAANSSTYLNSGIGYWNNSNNDYVPHQSHHHQQSNLSRPESVNMYIPDDVVGALIGRKGSNIRQIIQQTGASLKIMEETIFIDQEPMRRVVINGVIDALFKAQYFIYDKVVEEGKGPQDHQIDDIRLTVEMSVPTEMVGRLIGKAGQNIRDIQKNFLCRIKFMTDPDESLPMQHPGETYVRIQGNYNAFLGAQKKIREMLIKAMTRTSFRGYGGNRRKTDSDQEQSPNGSGNASGNSDDVAVIPMPNDNGALVENSFVPS